MHLGGGISLQADGYKVTIDNQGAYSKTGHIWNDGSILNINYSVLGVFLTAQEKLSVFYGAAELSFLEKDTLKIALDYVNGTNENKTLSEKVSFQEIAPSISYQYNSKFPYIFIILC